MRLFVDVVVVVAKLGAVFVGVVVGLVRGSLRLLCCVDDVDSVC